MSQPAAFDPTKPLYSKPAIVSRVYRIGRFGVLLTILTIAALAYFVTSSATHWTQSWVLAFAAAWGIGGPMWFFYEYFFIYRVHGTGESWDLFKHGQQLSGAVWVALTAALVLFGNSDYVKPEVRSFRCLLDNSQTDTPGASAAQKTVLLCTPTR